MSDWEEMRKAAQKVQTIMPGHGVMLNAASVLAVLADREALKKLLGKARDGLKLLLEKDGGWGFDHHRHAGAILAEIEATLAQGKSAVGEKT